MPNLKRLLRCRLAYGRLITPEMRVDPTRFSEEEYPVYCVKCGYELRALTEPRCPECGTPFDRGRLLVERYVLERQPRSNRWYRLSVWLGRLAWIVFALCVGIWAALVGPHLLGDGINPLHYAITFLAFLIVLVLGFPLFVVAAVLWWISSPRHGEKRLRVADALFRRRPSPGPQSHAVFRDRGGSANGRTRSP